MPLQAITANRLDDGAVVYLSVDGDWVTELARAAVAEGTAAAAALTQAGERGVAGQQVVGPYLIEIEAGAAGLRPLRFKEVLRAQGPSIRYGADAQSV